MKYTEEHEDQWIEEHWDEFLAFTNHLVTKETYEGYLLNFIIHKTEEENE